MALIYRHNAGDPCRPPDVARSSVQAHADAQPYNRPRATNEGGVEATV
ncbi:hypothetical protein BJB45_19100 [Halomonas huangheensis]|uniref:Uncharacterized protein n=1 Tax=Halomonas huangheensis TaxID=1178482 RepID=W1N6E1_9GAMM|nr:hypothetical protein BJB45_19100 [Halomonas huangheensis]